MTHSNVSLARAFGLLCVVSLLGPAGCGGGDDDGAPPRKPDTGYGKGETAPSPPTCDALCARLGECGAELCNEDTNSTRYDALAEVLTTQCNASRTAATIAQVTDAQWQCYFGDSCRQVFDYAECPGGGSYYCK